VVARGVEPCAASTRHGRRGVTHYVKLLEEIEPDHVHVLVDGQIVSLGGPELAQQIEHEGYDTFRPVAL